MKKHGKFKDDKIVRFLEQKVCAEEDARKLDGKSGWDKQAKCLKSNVKVFVLHPGRNGKPR